METTQTLWPLRAAQAPQMAPNGPLHWRAKNNFFLPKKSVLSLTRGYLCWGFLFIPSMFVQTDLHFHGYYQKS